MALFGKRETVFEVQGDKARWIRAKETLTREGIRIMEALSREGEAPVCGCGAKLDHRDFGPNGRIDRRIYYIAVRPEDAEAARRLLREL